MSHHRRFDSSNYHLIVWSWIHLAFLLPPIVSRSLSIKTKQQHSAKMPPNWIEDSSIVQSGEKKKRKERRKLHNFNLITSQHTQHTIHRGQLNRMTERRRNEMMLADVVIQYFYYEPEWSEYLNISFLLAQSTQIYRVCDVCFALLFWNLRYWEQISLRQWKMSIEFYDTEKIKKYIYDEDEMLN